jgi:hypothetical protein
VDALCWQRVNELFEAAIALAADDRPAFLAEVCAGDEELGHQLRRLVQAHERAAGFLETPVATEALRILASPHHPTATQVLLLDLHVGQSFRGTERFTIRRQLGAGGMGVVYEVDDRARSEVVALKTLLRARAAEIYRLKREFRSLADVAHPNLVSLYELVVEGAHCFFTMELVDGVNLVKYVRDPAAAAIRYDRIRHALRQVIDGIGFLHGQGKLHRDVKPSNILVTRDARVVILDFGLTSDVDSDDASIGESMAGTPAYLAPERRAGTAPSPCDDWYSVGVTLYEALTGRVPFDGPVDEMQRRKRESDPDPPAASAAGIPEDLNAVCMGLLCRDPARRLTGAQAARMLEPVPGTAAEAAPSDADIEPRFIGRARHIDLLTDALSQAQQGLATTVYVHGPSGIGKSCLVEHFLDTVPTRGTMVVLRGRCYEREAVPYKALDGVVDSLSQHLRTLPRPRVEALLPPNITALFRLFPVMQQVGAGLLVRDDFREAADPLVLRQRAFDALRELLARIAVLAPLVIYIDDLHWADADSAALLAELLRPPQAPPALTIACLRAEEIASKPFLQRLVAGQNAQAPVSLPVEPMSNDEARELLTSTIGGDRTVSDADLARLAEDAGGNPFLLRHVAGYLATRRPGTGRATFAEMLDERLRALPPGSRRFLEALAICGRAMAPDVVHTAAGLAGDERPLVARLRANQFLRASGSAHRVEPYHDRIRETVAASVSSDDRRCLHASIARALVAHRVDDSEALYEHYREAGDGDEAAAYAALAANKADAALAFDRAAAYYRAALELRAPAGAQRDWKERLALALANAGRPADAGDAYLDAARDADPARRVELERVAAEQFLIGGHIDRGMVVIRRVLSAVHLRLARGPRTALASLIYRRAQLRWRGRAFVERRADRIPPADLLKVDTCGSVATGLAMVDYVNAAHFGTRHLLLALEAGEPARIARALANEACYVAAGGGRQRRRAVEALARAEEMAARVGDPQALALCSLMRGASAFLVGDWDATHAHSTRALTMMRDQYVATTWELNSASAFRLYARLLQGELREVSRELPGLLASSRERGNLYFETELRTRANLVWLAADKPDEGVEAASEAMRRWSHAGFHRQHYTYMLDRVQTELYRGDARAAWQVVANNQKALQRAQLLRIQFLRIEAAYMRARCALLMAASGEHPRPFLAIARRDARTIAREKMMWSVPHSDLLFRDRRVPARRRSRRPSAAHPGGGRLRTREHESVRGRDAAPAQRAGEQRRDARSASDGR